MKTTTKQLLQFMLVSFLLFSTLPYVASAEQEWTIDGNTVYVDDALLYASATPHTLSGSGWVEFEFSSKVYTGDVDFIWGFNQPGTKPSLPQIWSYYNHPTETITYEERYLSKTFTNVLSYENLGISNYSSYSVNYGNSNNTQLFKVNVIDPSCSCERYYIVAFSEYQQNGEEYILSGNHDVETIEIIDNYYYDWKPLELEFETLHYEYQGMNTWYLLKNTPITQDITYKIRARINLDFNSGNSSGKYWWAFKPSSETLQQSISNNHLYYLDPWWDANWNYYKIIKIEADFIDTMLVNFPILVHNTSTDFQHAQPDGDDFVCVALDNSTVYPHEIEYFNYSSNELALWVNISSISPTTDTYFLLYYGNAGCANQQQVKLTWNAGYSLVYHFTNSTDYAYDATQYDNRGEKVHTPTLNASGKIIGGLYCHYDGGDAHTLKTPDDASLDMSDAVTVEWWSNPDATPVYFREWSKGDYDTDMNYWVSHDNPKSNFYMYSGGYRNNLWTTNPSASWQFWGISYDEATIIQVANSTVDENGAWGPYTFVTNNDYFRIGIGQASEESGCVACTMEGYVDELRISSVARNASWMRATFNSTNYTTGFITIGTEVTRPLTTAIPEVTGYSPSNSSSDICPCGDYLSVSIQDIFGNNMNLTIHLNSSQNSTYVTILNFTNIPNGTYYVCLPSSYFTTFFNTTYYWYYNVSSYIDVTYYNKSGIFHFTTTTPEECYSSSQDFTWILPVAVILSIMFFMVMKKKTPQRRR